MAVAATAIAGQVYVVTDTGIAYPNLYIAIVGESTLHAKTVAMKLGAGVLESARCDDRLIRAIMTPEAMIEELAGREPCNLDDLPIEAREAWLAGSKWGASRCLWYDEAGRLFDSFRRDYNTGLQDTFMDLYDAETVERRTQGRGYVKIDHPHVSCMLASTPISIKEALVDIGMWESGFWPRFLLYFQDEMVPYAESNRDPVPDSVIAALEKWRERRDQLELKMAASVERDYNTQFERVRNQIAATPQSNLRAFMGRGVTKRLKIALIFAALDGGTIIHDEHWDVAGRLVGRFDEYVKTMNDWCRRQSGTKESDSERLMRHLRECGGADTARNVERALHWGADKLKQAVTEASGLVVTSPGTRSDSTILRLDSVPVSV